MLTGVFFLGASSSEELLESEELSCFFVTFD